MNPEQPAKQVTDPAEAITQPPQASAIQTAPAGQSPLPATQAITPATAANVASANLITDVNRSTLQFILHHDLLAFFLMVVPTLAWEIFWIPFGFSLISNAPDNNGSSAKGYFYGIILPLILIAVWYGRIRKKIEDAFIAQFAAANGFAYAKALFKIAPLGRIFNISGAYALQFGDLVTGQVDQQGFNLFLYNYTIGYGRSSRTIYYTVMEVELSGNVPNIYAAVRPKHDPFRPLQKLGNEQAIHLEGDFDNYYTVYAEPGQEINALEIFAPDLMQQLVDEPEHFDIELVGNHLNIYLRRFISQKAELSSMFNFAKAIGAKVNPVAGRMKYNSDAPVPAVTGPTQPAKHMSRVGEIFIIAFCVLMTLFITFAAIASTFQN